MLFDIGDRILVPSNGFTAVIVAISYSTATGHEYRVIWDHTPNAEYSYIASDVDNQWQLLGKNYFHANVVTLPAGVEYIPLEVKIDSSIEANSIKVQCNGHHTWIDVGFHHSKMVCKYCDQEKM